MALWAPFAIRRDAPAQKTGYSVGTSGPKRGDVKHSAEGDWTGIYSVLDDVSKYPSGRYKHPASWQFTVGYDSIEQHYPYNTNCWHAGDTDDDGGVAANIDLVGIEHLGFAGEPLTDYQVAATVKVSQWCAEQEGITKFARYPIQANVWTLAEHKQVSNVPTFCPSDRIPWVTILTALRETEDEMTDAERALLNKLAKDLVAEQKETKRWRTFAEAVIGLHQGRLDAQDGWNAVTEATVAALHPEGAPE